MLIDLFDNIIQAAAFAPKAAVTDNTAQVSAIFDCANKTSVMLSGIVGTNADADMTYTVLIEEGDNSALSDAAAVADSDLLGVEAMGLDYASDGKTFKIGYIGTKRYIRATITPVNNTGNVFLAGNWLAVPKKLPATTQVV